MPDGTIWYDPGRIGELHRRVQAVVDDLSGIRCGDAAADVARSAVAATLGHLDQDWMPALARIMASDALLRPFDEVPVDDVIAFLRDDPLGEVVFDLIDVADQGDLDDLDGNWSTQDVAAATDPAVVRELVTQLIEERGLDVSADEVGSLVTTVTAVAGRLVDSDEAWEGIDDEVGWYEGVTGAIGDLAGAAWDRLSTYGQYLSQSGMRMMRDPVQTVRDVSSGTFLLEQAAAAEAILVEDGELYMGDDDGRCGTAGECITGARTLPGASATTFGHSVLIAEDDADDVGDDLIAHEFRHVADVETVGGAGFYGSYAANYLWNLSFEVDDVVLDGEPVDEAHDDAYDHVIWEQRAVAAEGG